MKMIALSTYIEVRTHSLFLVIRVKKTASVVK